VPSAKNTFHISHSIVLKKERTQSELKKAIEKWKTSVSQIRNDPEIANLQSVLEIGKNALLTTQSEELKMQAKGSLELIEERKVTVSLYQLIFPLESELGQCFCEALRIAEYLKKTLKSHLEYQAHPISPLSIFLIVFCLFLFSLASPDLFYCVDKYRRFNEII